MFIVLSRTIHKLHYPIQEFLKFALFFQSPQPSPSEDDIKRINALIANITKVGIIFDSFQILHYLKKAMKVIKQLECNVSSKFLAFKNYHFSRSLIIKFFSANSLLKKSSVIFRIP